MKRYRKWIIAFGFAVGISIISIISKGIGNYFYFALVLQPTLAPFYVLLIFVGINLQNRLFAKRKYFSYSLSLIVLINVSSFIANLISPFIGIDFEDISLSLHFIGTTFILLFSSFIKSVKESVERKIELREYEYEKTQAALQLLKRQLNPHFLFNTLNSIYGKATQQSPETADMILNLSDMLRYQLKMETTTEVTLQEEIDFLQHYIFFEKRRLPINLTINSHFEMDDPNMKVAPNMFTPLIENTFKHGVVAPEEATISIFFLQTGKTVSLQTTNNISMSKLKESGTGISNLKKRLEFLYPNRYELKLEKLNNLFYATLRIRL